MKRNLKKYNDFINEELTASEKLSNDQLVHSLKRHAEVGSSKSSAHEMFLILRSNFYDRIVNMTDDHCNLGSVEADNADSCQFLFFQAQCRQ